MAAPARNHVSLIEHKSMRFLITDRPTDQNIPDYLKILKDNNVTELVRVCEPTYDTSTIGAAGIRIHDWAFDDGDPPPPATIKSWLELTRTVVAAKGTIAVHCVAGLGRAPVMVALSLIESGMTPEDAVMFIRDKRRGAINRKQLEFLRTYKPENKGKCVVM